MLLRICDSCVFYQEDLGTCQAFPQGVPLRVDEGHFEIRDDQVGDTIYEMDKDKYDRWEMYRRVNPTLKFPILITYEIPDVGDSIESVESEQD